MRVPFGRLGIVAAGVIVQLAVLVLAHDLVYLARYGSRYGEALVHAGHGDGWRTAVVSSIVLGGLVSVAAAARLLRLGFLVHRARASGARAALPPGALFRMWLRVGPALALTTVALLTLQENLEQSALHGSSAGLAILLAPEYAGGLWITLAIGFVVGLVVALVAWRFRALIALLRAAGDREVPSRPLSAGRPRVSVDRPSASILGRRSALRAPPVGLPSI